jgi:hypothetical protein
VARRHLIRPRLCRGGQPAARQPALASAEAALWRKQEQRPLLPRDEVPPELAAWARAVGVSRLSARTAAQAEKDLRTYRHLNWLARRELSNRLMSMISAEVTPPPPLPVNPLDAMATVVARYRPQDDSAWSEPETRYKMARGVSARAFAATSPVPPGN